MSDLEVLFPKPQVVLVLGSRVLINPATLEHFDSIAKLGAAAFGLMAEPSAVKYLEFSKHRELIQQVIKDCTTLGWWRRRRLPVPVAFELVLHILRVNADFFEQALLAQASQLVGAVQSKR